MRSPSRPLAAGVLLGTAVLTLTACGRQHIGSGPSPSPTPSAHGPARGNVEADSDGGAPHYRENNGFKVPREMTPAGEEAARKEAARIEPVLKRLWKEHGWDPDSVRTALLRLGYRTGDGLQPGTLIVSGMGERHILTQIDPITPEGALFALRVRKDACVHGAVQPSGSQLEVSGPYLETGCFEPRGGH
ncbi:hypothetical protein [Streptomyces paromomycinus]|uniref:Lipoprotein n=1 Tax=Streptomyces paromomycinus TaxID=92743 RepID=A0A401W1V0_STREY|nr:hypothetical protein [Streptomyces paromomycinus]GCD43303.1 hypothetical protein GKJPGBOP_02984 [Streptomyces paromomycinus]